MVTNEERVTLCNKSYEIFEIYSLIGNSWKPLISFSEKLSKMALFEASSETY